MKPSLEDFLKVEKVRCVKAYGDCLTVGKEYSVLDIRMEVKVKDDEGDNHYWESDHFEPVLESAENPPQDIELTPEFEAVEPAIADNSEVNTQDNSEVNTQDNSVNIQDTPKFKVGDKVYYRAYADICVVSDVSDLGEVQIKGWGEDYYNSRYFCHATPENYERLQATFPDIEFEQPPTQADIDNEAVDKLAQAMKNKLAKKREQGYHGWETCKHGDLVQLLINHVDKGDPVDVANFCAFLFARGEKLTQAVLVDFLPSLK